MPALSPSSPKYRPIPSVAFISIPLPLQKRPFLQDAAPNIQEFDLRCWFLQDNDAFHHLLKRLSSVQTLCHRRLRLSGCIDL
ncbi:hypothetical protein EST38_g10364 [Candolleomyces aberdarensis]|uniref:Uncharacterized protein n=1 Tax=Candolleomyces aberdarensis TaxID=2316362 RepID=A0A4Q2D7K0_9AGAR|nr:hypothetical protein EST38_g10364 [Candolleomyces aberdarensis]